MRKKHESTETGDPGVAPLFERLQAVERQLTDLKKQAEQHWSEEARQFALIDQFLSPAMDIESLIKQLGELGRNQNQLIIQMQGVMLQMQGVVERELQDMRSALRLSLGAAELDPEGQARALGN